MADRSQWKHLAGFALSGAIAFTVDVIVTKTSAALLHWPWPVARLIAISCAMVVAWLCHRRFTFALAVRVSLQEFLRYAAMGWSAALLNYLVFLAVLWARPELEPALAIALSSLVAMTYSYLVMRFGVFARR